MQNKESQEILRIIPSIDKILQWQEIQKYQDHIHHDYLVAVLRDSVDEYRRQVIEGKSFVLDDLKKILINDLEELTQHYFTYAINGIGIVLHTGLGRAPFSTGIADIMRSVSAAYSRLQIDAEGKRADRYKKISRLLNILTGAEAGIVVNNNAAATMLILNAVAKGKEVIVSRGQLIEIGGSFRIPDVMAQSGAIMREIGTTNRTHLKDYEGAINENTGAIIRVHQSNYTISGFTKEVPLEDLVMLGKKYRIPVIDDLGSGALIDFSKYGLPKEPLIQDSVKAGADIICFSGDKLIGGPQCGIIIGKRSTIEQIKKNPLTRALRCDK
ncbi:L-seryl-tRNA(Sec) selenium transferase, partial [candidate division WOR-3 bacterium RBG_13_43_14]